MAKEYQGDDDGERTKRLDIILNGQPVPGMTLVLAPNPSPMTHLGTNTYLVGHDRLTVIDPGPDDPRHLSALVAAIAGRRVDRIVVTHSHLDHSALAPALSRATGVPVVGFGDSLSGRSAVMARLAEAGLTAGGEGVDLRFRPDLVVAGGDMVETDAGPLRVIHTPGHMGNHISLALGDLIFSGDHVMDWASTLVSPPDGDLTDYMRSLTRLRDEGAAVLLPGHGGPVTDPAARIAALIAHRREREAQILAALATGSATVADLTARIYTDTPIALHPAAARNVFAHLIDLAGRNLISADPDLRIDARFTPT